MKDAEASHIDLPKNYHILTLVLSMDIQRFTGNIVHKYLEIITKKQLDIDKLLCNKLDYTQVALFRKKF